MRQKNRFQFLKYRDAIQQKVKLSFNNNSVENEVDTDSFFGSCIENWTHHNSSLNFLKFRKNVGRYALSLKLLLLHKEEVCDELLLLLRENDKSSLEPALDLVAALACDIREDFYFRIHQFITEIANIIIVHYHDAELMNCGFNSLSHIVYFLNRLMLNDKQNILKIFEPLLTHKSDVIQTFTSEAVAFVLRRLSDYDKLQSILYNYYSSKSDYSSLGYLFYAIFDGTDKNFHSKFDDLLPQILKSCCGVSTPISKYRQLALESSQLSNIFRDGIEKFMSLVFEKKSNTETSRKFGRPLYDNIAAIIKLQLASSVEPAFNLFEKFALLCHSKNLFYASENLVVDLFKAILPIGQNLTHRLLKNILPLCSDSFNAYYIIRLSLFDKSFSLASKLEILTKLVSWINFERDVLPNLNCFLIEYAHQFDSKMVETLARISITRYTARQDLFNLTLAGSFKNFNQFEKLSGFFNRVFGQEIASLESLHPDFFNCAILLKSLNPLSDVLDQRTLQVRIAEVVAHINSTSHDRNFWFEILHSLLKIAIKYEDWNSGFKNCLESLDLDSAITWLCTLDYNNDNLSTIVITLECINDLNKILKLSTSETLLYERLSQFMSAPSHSVRLTAINCIKSFIHNSNNKTLAQTLIPVVDRCLAAESIAINSHTFRDVILLILHLHAGKPETSVSEFGNIASKFAIQYLLGLMHSNFLPIWLPLQDALLSHNDTSISKNKMTVFWPIFQKIFENTSSMPIKCEGANSLDEINVIDCGISLNTLVKINSRDHPDAVHINFRRTLKPEILVRGSRIDWQTYRFNLWRSVSPQMISVKNRFFVPAFLHFVNEEYFEKPTRSKEEFLLTMLESFSELDDLSSVYQEPRVTRVLMDILASQKPILQKAALKCLLRYRKSAWIAYEENLKLLAEPTKFRDQVRNFTLSGSIEDSRHRSEVAPIYLRIIFGRLLMDQKQYGSGIFSSLAESNDQELLYFLHLLFAPLKLRPSLYFYEDMCIYPKSSEQIVRCASEMRQRLVTGELRWGLLQALCQTIKLVLRYLGHKPGIYGNLVEFALCLLLLGISPVEHHEVMEADEDIKQKRVPKQMKLARVTACELLVHLMNFNEQKNLTREHIALIKTTLFNPSRLEKFSKEVITSSSEHLFFKILSQASQNEAQASGLFDASVLATFEMMLKHPKLKQECADSLLSIIQTLLFSSENAFGKELVRPIVRSVVSYLQTRLLNLTKSYSRTSQKALSSPSVLNVFRLLTFLADPSCDLTNNVLTASDASSLLEGLCLYLAKVTTPTARNIVGGWKRRRQKDGVMVNSDETATKLKNQLMSRDEAEAELMRLSMCLMKITDHVGVHLKRWARLLFQIESRVCRGLLCQVIDIAASRLPSTSFDYLIEKQALGVNKPKNLFSNGSIQANLHDAIRKMQNSDSTVVCITIIGRLLEASNAYDQYRLDQPDVVSQERALSQAGILCNLFKVPDLCSSELAEIIHLSMIGQAVFMMDKGNLQVRDAALDYFTQVAKICLEIYQTSGQDDLIRKLILGSLWPGLQRALRQFSGPRRIHFLRLLNMLVKYLGSHPWFKPLTLIADPDNPSSCFYASLQSGTLNRQISAMQRLANFLTNPLTLLSKKTMAELEQEWPPSQKFVMPLHHLKGLFVPLIQFYLRAEINTDAPGIINPNCDDRLRLMNHALEALSATASHLDWVCYRELLSGALKLITRSKQEDQDTVSTSLVSRDVAVNYITKLIEAFNPPNWSDNTELAPKHEVKTFEEKLGEAEFEEQYDEIGKDCELEADEKSDFALGKLFPNLDQENEEQEKLIERNEAIRKFMLQVVKRLQKFIVGKGRLGKKKPRKRDAKNKRHMENDRSKEVGPIIHVPLTVALVSLLSRLPSGNLGSHLPQIILKLVEYLRPSKENTPDVRKEALTAIIRIVKMLRGGRVFDNVLVTIAHQLNKGYACQQVRIFCLDRIMAEVERFAGGGLWYYKPGDFDLAARLLTRLYLDEMIGQLAEEIDNRRAAGQTVTSTLNRKTIDPHELIQQDLSAQDHQVLPEARGLKAPDGLSRLCRMISMDALCQLFEEITKAVWNASTGEAYKSKSSSEDIERAKENYGKAAESLGCGLKYRKRALARLQAALNRLSTRSGLLCPKQLQLCHLEPQAVLQLTLQIAKKNIHLCVLEEEYSKLPRWAQLETKTADTAKKKLACTIPQGWGPCHSALLEPRWDYLGIPPEPKRDGSLTTKAQSSSSQAFMLAEMAMHSIEGLIASIKDFKKLAVEQVQEIILLVSIGLKSHLIRILHGCMKCIYRILNISQDANVINSKQLSWIVDNLFNLLTIHAGSFTTGASSKDVHMASFSQIFFRTMGSLIKFSNGESFLTVHQISALIDCVDIELKKDSHGNATVLYLLHAFLSKCLRDPKHCEENHNEVNFFGLQGKMDLRLLAEKMKVVKTKKGDKEDIRLKDLVHDRVKYFIMFSIKDSVRRIARRCLLTYLLNYPTNTNILNDLVNEFLGSLVTTSQSRITVKESVVLFLRDLVLELTPSRLTKSDLDESILLAVCTAIQRETDSKLRLKMISLVRTLFTRLSSETAIDRFLKYILPFLNAYKIHQLPIRLLALQLIPALLNLNKELSIDTHGNNLMKIIINNILPTTLTRIKILRFTHPHMFIKDRDCTPAPVTDDFGGDNEWLSGIKDARIEDLVQGNDLDNEESDQEKDQTEEQLSENEQAQEQEEKEENSLEKDVCISLDDKRSELVSSKAGKRYYFLFATLELSLRLINFIITKMSTRSVDETVSSSLCSPLWSLIIQHVPKKDHLPEEELVEFSDADSYFENQGQRLIDLYATLLTRNGKAQKSLANKHSNLYTEPENEEYAGLLQLKHMGTAEWAIRCLHLLLRHERSSLQSKLSSMGEGVATYKPVTHFFAQLAKQRGTDYSILLPKTITGLLSALLNLWEHVSSDDHYFTVYEESSWLQEYLLPAIQCLTVFAHIEMGRKPVLFVLQFANRLALDELNNRRHSFAQRSMALQLTSSLLSELGQCETPKAEVLRTADQQKQSPEYQAQDEDNITLESTLPLQKDIPSYLAYLRLASRLYSRELKNRDRLAFIAASNLHGHDEDLPIKKQNKLDTKSSLRARLRRKRREAQLRRALLCSDMDKSAEAFQKILSFNSMAARNAAKMADDLVDLIDCTGEQIIKSIDPNNLQISSKLWREICNHTQNRALRKRVEKEQISLGRKATGLPLRTKAQNEGNKRAFVQLENNPDNENLYFEQEEKLKRRRKDSKKSKPLKRSLKLTLEDLSLRNKKRKLNI